MNHSIKRRYVASLSGNLLRGGVTLLTAVLLARWLGANDYGRMVFLFSIFVAFRQFFDMGSSSAFFTFISQRARTLKYIQVFWIWVAVQLSLSLAIVNFFIYCGAGDLIWGSESQLLINLALLASFTQGYAWPIASQMAEASRETIKVQRLGVIFAFIYLMTVCLLWFFDVLILSLIFLVIVIEWAICSLIAARMYKNYVFLRDEVDSAEISIKDIFSEFREYCLPLIPYAWVAFLYELADRWMLQNWGGSAQQAYYAVAMQFSIIALLATTSVLRIFWKEVAEANYQENRQKIISIYFRASRFLYLISSIIVGLFLPWSKDILSNLLGRDYEAGSATLAIMLIYPIHQTMGQIGGTVLYAMGKVGLQVKLGIVFMLISLFISYFAMAPKNHFIPGLELGSEGLALKMVMLQIVSVNILAWSISRVLETEYHWHYQIIVLIFCISLGYLIFFISSMLLHANLHIFFKFFIATIAYLTSIGFLIYAFPVLAGLTKAEIKDEISIKFRFLRSSD